MASSGVEGTTGAPRFPGSGAPDTGADFEEVADYAAYRGNRIRGTNAARVAFAYETNGLQWYETDTDEVFQYNGTGWVDITPGVGVASRTTNIVKASTTDYSKASLDVSSSEGCVSFSDNEFTVSSDGFYQVSGGNIWESNSSGKRTLKIYVNGSETEIADIRDAHVGNSMRLTVAGIVELNATDTVALYRYQNSGGSINETGCFLTIARVGI